MPAIKKKGAIFAIYTDSPARSTRSQITAPPPPSSSLPVKSTTSPTKKPTVSRKALSAVQPKSLGFPSDPPSKLDKGKGKSKALDHSTDDSGLPSVNPKTLSRATAPVQPKRTGMIAPKRQFEIFSAPSAPSSPTGPTLPTPSSRLLAAESPIKKTRSTPRRPIVENKENATPLVDSPASGTRSKVRGTPSAGISSPIQALRLASRTPRAGVEALVGDGKGTLTLKKGRAVARLMKESEAGEVLGDVSEAYGAEGSAPSGFETQRH